jgi:hypothetical protein
MSTATGVAFDRVCVIEGLPKPVAEYQFAAARGRQWRFDWCWPDRKIALEVDGGLWNVGRHQRPAGYRADMEKLNAAAALGWRIFRCEPTTLTSAPLLDLLREALR